jgi:hypothetical protein
MEASKQDERSDFEYWLEDRKEKLDNLFKHVVEAAHDIEDEGVVVPYTEDAYRLFAELLYYDILRYSDSGESSGTEE